QPHQHMSMQAPVAAPAPPPAAPDAQSRRGHVALLTGILSLLFGFCCTPIGLIGGVVAVFLGHQAVKEARERGMEDTTARIAFWLGIGTIVLAIGLFILNMIIMALFPGL